MSLSELGFRRDRRVPFTVRAPLVADSGGQRIIEEASTIDLSESGVRIRLTSKIEPGQIVELFLNKRPEPCRVIWTSPGKATEELIAGLEFTTPLPEPRRRRPPPFSEFEPTN